MPGGLTMRRQSPADQNRFIPQNDRKQRIMRETIFVTKFRSAAGKAMIRLLIDSLRAFGGEMSRCPMWVFNVNPQEFPGRDLEGPAVQVIPLDVPADLLEYELGDKVYACARAEQLAPAETGALVWIDASCLIAKPPMLYALDENTDAAVRPVHIRNVGLTASEPLNDYWREVYRTVGISDLETRIVSFVDEQIIRPYYNTHAFAVNPAVGLLRRWLDLFRRLIGDQAFQAGACRDALHRIFLHQALLSAQIEADLAPERVRILPPEYNYPYNLHSSISAARRAKALNDLATLTYEERSLDPAVIDDIEIHEPLRSFLCAYAGSSDRQN